MIRYAGMRAEENKSNNDFGQLPVGSYVAKVLKTEVHGREPDQSLWLYLDVSEGEYKDFFMKKFDAQTKAGSKFGDVKFKGTYRLRIPNPDNTKAMYPESDLARMNDMIFRFEKSNPGFHWDGEELKLKGLTVGICMQEDSYNGNTFTKIAKLATADDVRLGLVKDMKPKKHNGDADDTAFITTPPAPAETIDPQSGFTAIETDELPFE